MPNPFLSIVALVLPLAGLFFVWRRRSWKIWQRILASILVLIVTRMWLVNVMHMRLELDGSGIMPMVRWGTNEENYSKLEKSREEMKPLEASAPIVAKAAPAAPVEAAKPAYTAYWADFRGPGRAGVYDQMPILTVWPATGLKQLWRQPIGGGYASFAIANGRAFTIEQRRKKEAVVAYDMANGRELWAHSYDANFQEAMGGDGPRATPVWNAGLVYSLGATGELRCLDAATGSVRWSKNILADNSAQNIQWGMANSPLIVDDMVIVMPGGTNGKSIVAYNKLNGARVWSSLDDKATYTSPMLVTLGGKRQILAVTASRAVGLEPASGALLWEFPWKTEYDINSALPVVVDESHFLISAGYGHGAALVEVAPTGAKAVWQNTKMKNKFNHSVLYNGYLYGFDESILACIDVKTGDLKWKGGRYGYGQLLLAGGYLVITSEQGDVALVKATPEGHQEVAKFTAIEGKTWNSPAISDGYLLVRNTSEMACYRIGK
jgi:outer membrane protein assembly factor BamB